MKRKNKYLSKTDPLPNQRAFIDSSASELMYSGAWGAGKSLILCWKACKMAHNGFPVLLCRKEFASFRSTTLRVLSDILSPGTFKYHNKSEHIFMIKPPKGFIYYCGLDKPEKIQSSEYGWIGVDEGTDIQENDWLMLKGRLRALGSPYYQIATTTNPASPGHFL